MTSIKNNRVTSGRPYGASLMCVCALVLTSGCALLKSGRSEPNAQIDSLELGKDKLGRTVTIAVLSAQVSRYADEYASMVAQAADDYAAAVNTSGARLAALKWKLGQATSAYINATGASAPLNALDMVVLASLSRMVVEDYWMKQGPTNDVMRMLNVHQQLETNAWAIVSGVLKPAQQQEVRELIQEWRQKNPDQRYVGAIRFREFVVALGKSIAQKSNKPNSVFSLLYLDPLAGLDPTAAAIEDTRRTADRMMYYAQRMPFLLTWQVEVLAYQLTDQPESQQLLQDARRLADASEVFAKTAGQLPSVINDQREAAINQVFAALESNEKATLGLMTETRQTLEASREAAASINTAIQSLNEFVRFVTPTNTTSTSTSTNSTPFNVLDYGTAAAQVANAAVELNTLLATVNQSTPRVEEWS